MSKWIHIIGIAGVTTAGIANAFKESGFKVTGSDKGFYSPVKDFLIKKGINISIGYNANRLEENNINPDIVLAQGTKGDKNTEYIKAKELNLNIKTYPLILKDHCVHDNSIVIVGSYGKTTITALLVNIFKISNSISYMYGGFDNQLNSNVRFKDNNTQYSIIEGDEYLTSINDKKSKFFYYSPKFLVINGIEWDHHDLFKTKEEYINNFIKLIESIPSNGLIIANNDSKEVRNVIKHAKCRVVKVSSDFNFDNDISYKLIKESKPFKVILKSQNDKNGNIMIPYERKFLGEFNDSNILLAAALAYELGISKYDIQKGISNFKGIKRRLEIKYHKRSYIIDDFGSTPAKAKFSIDSIINEFGNYNIICVFDPSSGSRSKNALAQFKNVFDTDFVKVILPRFSLLKKSNIDRFNENDLCTTLRNNGVKCEIEFDDNQLINKLESEFNKGNSIIVFLGSHSFRGVIDKLVEKVKE